MEIEKLDHKKLFMARDKKGYRFVIEAKNVKILGPECSCLFGVELFNKKEMINLYYNKSQSNEINNFIIEIRRLEKIYEQFSNKQIDNTGLPFVNLPSGFINEVKSKEFISVIRPSMGNACLIRTHLTKNIKIFKMVDNKKIECPKSELKGKKIIPMLELSSLWIHGTKYGLLLYVTEIQILD